MAIYDSETYLRDFNERAGIFSLSAFTGKGIDHLIEIINEWKE